MARISWDYAAEKQLMDYMQKSIEEGQKTATSLEEYAVLYDMPEGAIRQKYFKLMQDSNKKRVPGISVDIDDIMIQLGQLKALQSFVGEQRDIITLQKDTIDELRVQVGELQEFQVEYKKMLSVLDAFRKGTSINTLLKQAKNGDLSRIGEEH